MKKVFKEIIFPLIGFGLIYFFYLNAITSYGVLFFVFLLSGIELYDYLSKNREFDKKSCIVIIIIYFLTILFSVSSINEGSSQREQDSYSNGYSIGHQEGYSEGEHDAENAAENELDEKMNEMNDMLEEAYENGYNDALIDYGISE